MTEKWVLLCIIAVFNASSVFASGFAVFTQGTSALGQANAAVAHPTGASSLYFNPALLNELEGNQIEVGTTGVFADRSIELDSGNSEDSVDEWNYPSNVYWTRNASDRLAYGLGIFFPFGLSSEWDEDYEGRYLGTYGDILTIDINPAVSYRVTDALTVAAGFNALYLKATLQKKINQTAAYTLTDLILSGGTGGVLPALSMPLEDIDQNFEGDGWGYGYNIGILYKLSDRIQFGAAYRSHVDIVVDGTAEFSNVTPVLESSFSNTGGEADIRLPAQATAAVFFQLSDRFSVETGVRWEDWSSTDELKVNLDAEVFGQTSDITPRDWQATWTYNIGGQYRLTEAWAVNAGYLYGENAVPNTTFEPQVPDTDAHLFTLGAEWRNTSWSVATAVGYEYHESRHKKNSQGDPLETALTGSPSGTANGKYESTLYLVSLSIGYRF